MRARSIGVLAVVASSVVVGLTHQASAAGTPVASSVAGYTGTANVLDTFDRQAKAGWGSSPVGGSYSTTPADSFQVNGDGVMQVQPGHEAFATLSGVTSADEQAMMVFALPKVPVSGSGVYVGVELRRQANGDAYRVRARIESGGKLTLVTSRVVDGQEVMLGGYRTIATGVVAGQALVVDAYVAGGNDVTVGARAWTSSQPTAAWTTQRDTSAEPISGAGAVGLRLYNSSSSSSLAVDVKSLRGWSLSPTGSSPSPTVSTSTANPTTASTTTAASPTSTRSPTTAASPTTTARTTATPTTKVGPPTTTTSTTTTSPPVAAPPAPAPPVNAPPVVVAPPATTTAGSAPLGSSLYPVPAGSLVVSTSGSDSNSGSMSSPFRTIARAVSASTAGQTIVLRGGSYHESITIGPTKSPTIQAYPGEVVWLDGSVPVTNWVKSGSTWVSSGWTAQFDHSASFTKGSDAGGFVGAQNPMAAYPDQVFVDGAQLSQVSSGATPGVGQFAVNYSARTITIGTNPSGEEVRASDLSQALTVSGKVKLLGFGIRRYATSIPQIGTVYLGGQPAASCRT